MSEKCKNKIHCFLRPATVADIRELRRLFQDTVLTVNAKGYTPEEVKDWASCGDSTAHWEDLLSRFHFLVALNAGKQIVGFASVNGEGYLHSMFIHKDWQRKGIASALLSEMESYAGGRGTGEIISEVSITARPFFERQGYTVRKEQRARANRLELTNFVMTKKIAEMNYTTLRKRLSGRLHEDDIHEITFYAQGIEDEPVKSALYTLLFDEDKRIAENAAWVFAHFDLHSNQWLYPRHNELIDEAMRTPSGTKRRLLLGLLLRQPFTENGFRTDFFDFCLRCIVASDEPTAVRCLSVKLACEQCKFSPELLSELRTTLEMLEPESLSAGMKTARRNTLKSISGLIKAR